MNSSVVSLLTAPWTDSHSTVPRRVSQTLQTVHFRLTLVPVMISCFKHLTSLWVCKTWEGRLPSWQTWFKAFWPRQQTQVSVRECVWARFKCNYLIVPVDLVLRWFAPPLCFETDDSLCVVSSRELSWGLTACLPWTPFFWRFCMVCRRLPVDAWRQYWISTRAVAGTENKWGHNGGQGEQNISNNDTAKFNFMLLSISSINFASKLWLSDTEDWKGQSHAV